MKKYNFVWWLNPGWFGLVVIMPIFLYCSYGLALQDMTPFVLVLLAVVVFVTFSFLGKPDSEFQLVISRVGRSRFENLLTTFFFLTVIGYFVWFSDLIFNPSLIFNALSSSGFFTLRGVVETTPGLSSLAQLGIVYSTLCMVYVYCFGLKLSAKYKIFLFVVIFLAAFRAWAWSERLALIEVLMPLVVYYFSYERRLSRWFIVMLPVFGGIGVFGIFSLFEYFRSWEHYKAANDDLFGFMLARFFDYYITSVSNGLRYLDYNYSPCYSGESLFAFTYRLPIVGAFLRDNFSCSEFHLFLELYANPEFNLILWPAYIFSDVGYAFGLIVFLLFGWLYGYLYRNFSCGFFSMMFYPTLFVGLLEFLRQGYLHSSRLFYVYFGFLVVYLLINSSLSKQVQR